MDNNYNQSEYFEKVVQVNRVSKKTKGGDYRTLSVLAVVGDKKGKVGVGLGKARDVQSAVRKATTYAKKHLFDVVLDGRTIPHQVYIKQGAAKVLIKPAPSGSGVRAGGAVRVVMEAVGVHDVVSKILGTKNKASNVYATMEALRQLRSVKRIKLVSINSELEDQQVSDEMGQQKTEKTKKKIAKKENKK